MLRLIVPLTDEPILAVLKVSLNDKAKLLAPSRC